MYERLYHMNILRIMCAFKLQLLMKHCSNATSYNLLKQLPIWRRTTNQIKLLNIIRSIVIKLIAITDTYTSIIRQQQDTNFNKILFSLINC